MWGDSLPTLLRMKAWKLEKLGGQLSLVDLPTPEPRPGTIRVRMEASILLSYMRDYVAGKLPIYNAPKEPFVPGGNGIFQPTVVARGRVVGTWRRPAGDGQVDIQPFAPLTAAQERAAARSAAVYHRFAV